MYIFDEAALVSELARLSQSQRAAFAAAAATRQLGSYEWYAGRRNAPQLRSTVVRLWRALVEGQAAPAAWAQTLEEVMALLPDPDDDGSIHHAYAEDAVASVAYAIRAVLEDNPQEAGWAARRAYEAVDQAAIRMLDGQPATPDGERAILAHPLVQRELERQRRDYQTLAAQPSEEGIAVLSERAWGEAALTDEELPHCA